MFSDIVGYTALMGEDQELAFQLVKKNSKFHQEVIKIHHGKLIKELGDGVLCYFPKPEDAVAAAFKLQQHYFKSKELSLRIGIHFGEVILDRNDVFGDAVNIASRLQTLGSPGSVLFSQKIHEDITENSPLKSVSLGKFNLKNVKEPLEVFALANEGLVIPKRGEILKLLESRLKKFMLAGLVFLTLALVAFGIYHQSSINKLMAEPEKSIAVLPFENIDNNKDDDFLVEGLTEDIISQLSKISSLKVVPNPSSSSFKGNNEAYSVIGKAFDVNYLLIGTIQKLDLKIKIRVQLIEASSNKAIWAETFEENQSDIFKLQKTISQKIAESLSANLTDEELFKLAKEPTNQFKAYEYYLRGRQLYYSYNIKENQEAIIEFRKALWVDPKYALAWSGLGDAFSQNFSRFGLGNNWMDSSKLASQKSIQLDSNLSEGYKALANYYNYKGEFNLGLTMLKKAVEKNPTNVQAVGNLGTLYLQKGQLSDALIWGKKGVGVNPISYVPYQLVGWTYRLLGDYPNAILWLNKSIEKRHDRQTYEELALSYIANKQHDQAKKLIPSLLAIMDTTGHEDNETTKLKFFEASQLFESSGIISFFAKDLDKAEFFFKKSLKYNQDYGTDKWTYSPIYLGYLFSKNKNLIESEVMLEGALHLNLIEVEDMKSEDTEFIFNLSSLYAIKGDKGRSLHYLNLAKEKNWVDILKATQNPIFNDLHNNTQFKKIIQEIEKKISLMRENEINKR
ncbi:tetratricopeptide repeat protein [Aquiflexum sp. TKW24L]|nr:tetratricopeptide repeat protein [Aquiflexum sp. TKW24L]